MYRSKYEGGRYAIQRREQKKRNIYQLYVHFTENHSVQQYTSLEYWMNTKTALFLATLITLCLSDCVHDEFIKNTTRHYYNDYTQGRLLQTTTTGGIRIFMDYTQLTVGTTLEQNLIKRMMNVTANYFYNLLTVARLTRLYFPANTSQQCNILRIPDIYVTEGTIADIGVVVGNQVAPALYMAKSTPCAFLATNKRPIWGAIIWNVNATAFKYNAEGFQEMLFVGLHEMTHVLAFSAMMYHTYPSGSILGGNAASGYFLTSSFIKTQITNHFGCSTAQGLDVQDQDGTLISSHWEKHHVGNQFMISSNKKNAYVSRFTLAVFSSTGWYPTVNYSLAEPITWGKGKGCNFLNIDNCDFTQFCADRAYDCDWDATGIAQCDYDLFTGTCSVPRYFNNTICIDQNYELHNVNSYLSASERGGYNSRCFFSDYRQSGLAANSLNNRCYTTVCSITGAFIYILVNGFNLVCRSPNQTIPAVPGLDGTLTCPSDFSLVCGAKKTCTYNCNQNGGCFNGLCLCNGATAFTQTCASRAPATDTPITTGGRLLFGVQPTQQPSSWTRPSLRREYSFKGKCEEGYVFDPITKKCETCQQLYGCSKCNQKQCIKCDDGSEPELGKCFSK